MDTSTRKILTIICAKKNSSRYKNKNREFTPSVIRELLKARFLNKIVIATDDDEIEKLQALSKKRVEILRRKKNACDTNDSVFNVAKWAYYCLDDAYDYVILILPNVINFNLKGITKGLKIIEKNDLNEVRSYGKDGVENGVIIMKRDWFLNGKLSVYCGAVITDATEIHHKGQVQQ